MMQDLQHCCSRPPDLIAAEAGAEKGALETVLFNLVERSKSKCAGTLVPDAACQACLGSIPPSPGGVAGSDPEPIEEIARIGVDLLGATLMRRR